MGSSYFHILVNAGDGGGAQVGVEDVDAGDEGPAAARETEYIISSVADGGAVEIMRQQRFIQLRIQFQRNLQVPCVSIQREIPPSRE